KTQGAELLTGGKVLDEESRLIAPTVFTNTSREMKTYSEEVFAPIAVLEKVENFEEGLKAVNDSRYGLQAGVFTNNLAHFKFAVDQLQVGGIIFNDSPGFRIDHMPYGGVKDFCWGKAGLNY